MSESADIFANIDDWFNDTGSGSVQKDIHMDLILEGIKNQLLLARALGISVEMVSRVICEQDSVVICVSSPGAKKRCIGFSLPRS